VHLVGPGPDVRAITDSSCWAPPTPSWAARLSAASITATSEMHLIVRESRARKSGGSTRRPVSLSLSLIATTVMTPLLRECPPVLQRRLGDTTHRHAVDVDVARGHLAGHRRWTVDEVDDNAVLAHHHAIRGHSGADGAVGVLAQVPPLSVHRQDVGRPHQVVDVGQLPGAGMSRDVQVSVPLVDDVRAVLRQSLIARLTVFSLPGMRELASSTVSPGPLGWCARRGHSRTGQPAAPPASPCRSASPATRAASRVPGARLEHQVAP
jgi:hypothetical protein